MSNNITWDWEPPKAPPFLPKDRAEYIRLVHTLANSTDPLLTKMAGAFYDADPVITPREGRDPLHEHLRLSAERIRKRDLSKHFGVMAQRVAMIWGMFQLHSSRFWQPIFDLGWNGSDHDSYYMFEDTRFRLAGGWYKREYEQAPSVVSAPKASEYFDNAEFLKHDREYQRQKNSYDAWSERHFERSPEGRATKRFERLAATLSGDELTREFIKGTPLEFLYPMPEPKVSPDLPFSGTWVLAAQGYGKTTLLSKLILDRMNEPCSIIIFDSKPELSTFFRDKKFPKDVVVIDPDPFLALNPLDLGTHNVDILMYLFSALLDARFTPLQSVALRQAVYLTSLIPGATFATFTDIINNGAKKYPEIVAGLDDEERTFWERDYDSGTYRDTRAQIIWRLNLLRPPGSRARTMFNAPKTKVRLPPLMDGNTITIINNSIPELGGLQSEFFSRLFLVLILGAAEQRALLPESKKRPCYIFMDEAHTVIANEPNISDIIYRTRSQKIALLCAHQSLSQIKNEQVVSALSDCAIRYANCDNDAPSMAPHLGTTADLLRGLGVGEFILATRGNPTPQTIKVPLPDFSPYPALSPADIAQRTARFREEYCYVPQPKAEAAAIPTPAEPPASGEWGGKPVV